MEGAKTQENYTLSQKRLFSKDTVYRRRYKILFILCGFFFLASIMSVNAFAAQILKRGSISVDPDSAEKIDFYVPNTGVIVLDMEIKLANSKAYAYKEKLNVTLYDDRTNTVVDDDFDDYMDNGTIGSYSWYAWDYTDDHVSPGDCTYFIENESGSNHEIKIKYAIRLYTGFATSASFSVDKVTLNKRWDTQKVSIIPYPAGTYPVLREGFVSNEKIASVDYDFNCLDGLNLVVTGMAPGSTSTTIELDNGHKVTIPITVKKPKNPMFEYSNWNAYVGDTFKNKLLYTNKSIKWTSSNKNIATVSSSGKVTARKAGKCYIKAKVGGKSYKYSVNVKQIYPDYYSDLTEYNTRNNYFVLCIHNNGSKPLTISSGIKVEDDDYKTFDRNVYLKSPVTLKAGQQKNIRFYVKGRTTWYNCSDFTLFFKIKYGGKIYKCKTNYYYPYFGVSKYQRNGKWYKSYTDYEDYSRWNEG